MAYESVNIVGGVKGDPHRNVIKRTIKATNNNPNASVHITNDKDKDKPPHGAVHITTPTGQRILVNKNKVMVKLPDGRIVQAKDIQDKIRVSISGQGGKVFNSGNTGIPPTGIPNPTALVQTIINFVNDLLRSIFGPNPPQVTQP